MFSARSVARNAPRALARLSSVARPAPARHSALLRNRCIPFCPQASAFSTSLLRRAASGVDGELSAKLGSEIQFESEIKENEPQPVSIKDFLDNSPFKLQDTPGAQNVVLTRTYNNEK
jgi:complement component 1 Q subcomponent-binding protein, mitochondrial